MVFDKTKESNFKRFNKMGYSFLSKHIELSEYQKNKIFYGGRALGKTYALYMTMILATLKNPMIGENFTSEFITQEDSDFKYSNMERLIKDFNYFSGKYFDKIFHASKNSMGYDYTVKVLVDVQKLKIKFPEMLLV